MTIGSLIAAGTAYATNKYAQNKDALDFAVGDVPNIAKDIQEGKNPVDGFKGRQEADKFHRGFMADHKDNGKIDGSDLLKNSGFLRDLKKVEKIAMSPDGNLGQWGSRFEKKYNLSDPSELKKRTEEYKGFSDTIKQRQKHEGVLNQIIEAWTSAG